MSMSPSGIPTPIPIVIDVDEEVESCVTSAELEVDVDWAVKLAASIVEREACCEVAVVSVVEDVRAVEVVVEEASSVLMPISIVALP